MSLPSFRQDKAAAAPTGDEPGPVQQARTQARRRLIGAVVLLALGVLGFPLLFETQPRPMPVDIPIEVARKDTPAALLPPAPAARLAPAPKPAPSPPVPPADAGVEVAPAVVLATAPAPAPALPKPVEAAAADKPAQAAEPAAAPASGAKRFVVQVGAYTDPNSLREARQKVERLGLKTYTQEIETPAGKRTRVRVGPFDSRDEADRAGTRLKAAGMPANLLAL